MPVERFDGGLTITGPAITGYRAAVLRNGIVLYLETGLKPTRGVGVTQMVTMAKEYTGKTYPRSRRGLEAAGRDLAALLTTKSLDAVGETREVNALVGGVAADLAQDGAP